MSTQLSLILEIPGGDWIVKETEIPKPGPGEILIMIYSAGLNPVDWKIQHYGFAVDVYPAILGTDSAGVVVEVGEGVTRVEVGDRV